MKQVLHILLIVLLAHSCTHAQRSSYAGYADGTHYVRGKLNVATTGYGMRNGTNGYGVDSSIIPDSLDYYIAPFTEYPVYTRVTGSNTLRKVNNDYALNYPGTDADYRANRWLAPNKDGAYGFRYEGDSYGGVRLDTQARSLIPSYTYQYTLIAYNGAIYCGQNGSYPFNTAGTDGYYYRMKRTGGNTLIAESSPDGISWSTIFTYSNTYSGALYPFQYFTNDPRQHRCYSPTLTGFSTNVCVIGNSTEASYAGGAAVTDFLFTAAEQAMGFSYTSLAVPGHTIEQQLTAWQAQTTAQKMSYQAVIIRIGLNNLNPAISAATELAKIQGMVDTVRNQTAPGCKILLFTMTPCKQRLIDVYGINGAASYAKWQAMNSGILNSITNTDLKYDAHRAALQNANGNLDSIYEAYTAYDHIHPNTAGRKIIAQHYRRALQKLRLLPQTLYIKKPIEAGGTLDFPNTSAQTSADLTLHVIGAADGDYVQLSVPNAATAANTSYTAFVSAANTVTVRFVNSSAGAVNPASAVFRVTVYKQ